MIITCGQCTTQFQLEDARVPAAGIRVRCSVCKHAFFVPHPDAFEEDSVDAVDRAVGEVLASEPGGLPDPSADLGTPAPSAGRDAAAEDAWEFDDGGQLPDPGGDPRDRFEESFEAAREAVDDLLGSPWQSPEPAPAPTPLADGGAQPDEGAARVASATPAWDEPAREPSPLDDPWEKPAWSDEIQDFSAAAPEEVGEQSGPAALDEEASAVELDRHESGASRWWDRDLPADAEPQSTDGAAPGADDLELGDAGDHDESAVLGEALDAFEDAADDVEEAADLDPLEAELSAPDATRDDAIPEDWGFGASGVSDSLEQGDAEDVPSPASAQEGIAAPLPLGFGAPQEPERRRGSAVAWLARAGNGLGWSAVAILASATLWASVAPRSNPAQGGRAQALAGLEATGVAGRWVENATLGSLYVVSGELHNPGSETRAPGARLVVRLLDARGLPIDAAAASLGPPQGALALQAAGPEQLRAAGESGALELARTSVAPGGRIRFEAVVLELPDAAQRFDLAAAR